MVRVKVKGELGEGETIMGEGSEGETEGRGVRKKLWREKEVREKLWEEKGVRGKFWEEKAGRGNLGGEIMKGKLRMWWVYSTSKKGSEEKLVRNQTWVHLPMQ